MKKKIVIVIFILLFIVFSSFINFTDISKYDIVSGIAIDYDGYRWSVVCEVCLPSSSNDFGSSAEYVKGIGFTLSDALYNAGLKSSDILYTESAQLYVINENCMQQGEQLSHFFVGDNANLRAVAIISKQKAEKVLHDEKDSGSRAKSMTLADKLGAFCKENGYDMPHVMNFLKNGGSVIISKDGLPERRVAY